MDEAGLVETRSRGYGGERKVRLVRGGRNRVHDREEAEYVNSN